MEIRVRVGWRPRESVARAGLLLPICMSGSSLLVGPSLRSRPTAFIAGRIGVAFARVAPPVAGLASLSTSRPRHKCPPNQ